MKNYNLKIIDSESTATDKRFVEVHGCLDSHTVVPFEKAAYELLDSGAKNIQMNLAHLSYISSAGISALMGLTQRLRKQGGDLVLVNPTDKVFRVFRTLGFTNIFTIAADDIEARKT